MWAKVPLVLALLVGPLVGPAAASPDDAAVDDAPVDDAAVDDAAVDDGPEEAAGDDEDSGPGALPPPELELPPLRPVDLDDGAPSSSDASEGAPAAEPAPEAAGPDGTTVDGDLPVPPHLVRRGNPEPFPLEHRFAIGATGKGGISAGHVWSAPYVSPPSPGVGLRARYRLRFAPDYRITADGTLSLGGSDDGSVNPFGGYRFTVGVAHRLVDWGWFTWWIGLHKGVESFVFIPVPLVGVGNELSLYPIRWRWLVWDITLAVDTDAYVIAPSITGAISTGVLMQLWLAWIGFEVIAEGQGIVAVVANAVGGSVQARVLTGFSF